MAWLTRPLPHRMVLALSLILVAAIAMPEITTAKHQRPKRRNSLAGFVPTSIPPEPGEFIPPPVFTCSWNEQAPIHDYECAPGFTTQLPTFRLTEREGETLPHALFPDRGYYDLDGDGEPDGDLEGWNAAPALAHPDFAPRFTCNGPDGSSDASEYQCQFTVSGYTHHFLVDGIVSVAYTEGSGDTDQWFVPCDAPPAPCVAIDLTPPDTTITRGPSGTVATRNAELGFTASEAGASFECRRDGGGWEHCTSPRRYSALPDGYHRFQVRAADAGGNEDPTPATHEWAVDVTGPQIEVGKRDVRLTGRGRARVRIRCPASEASGRCSGKLTLKTAKRLRRGRRVFLGGARFAIKAGASTRVAVKLSRRNRRLVARRGPVRVIATARARDPLGNVAVIRRTIALMAPRR
jgi:hypothetical protein